MGPAPLILLAAALAGATTLAAETLWIRGLGRGAGTTPEALAAIVGLVLAGLGLGARFAARRAASDERPARRATWCLVGAGALVALSPHYIDMLPSLHLGLLDMTSADGGGSALWILLLAVPLALPASSLFGMLFPYLVRARVETLGHVGTRAGWIYALNTVGAVGGVVGALLLLPEIGETQTLRIAGGASILAAFCMLLAERPLPHGDGQPAHAAPGRSVEGKGVVAALAASGAAALVAQMAWFRMLEPLAGAHAWGVALLIAPVLAALAVGAALGGMLADRVKRADLLLTAVLAVAGMFVILSLPFAGGLPLRLVQADTDERLGTLVRGFLVTCSPAMVMFGAALPLGIRVRADWTGASAAPAGRLYGWNSLGALAGSVLASFVLLPKLGAERTLLVAAALVVVSGTALRLRMPGRARVSFAALHLLPLAVLLWPGLLADVVKAAPQVEEIVAARKPVPAGLTLADRDDLALYARWFAGERASAPGDVKRATLPVFEGRTGRISLIEEPDGFVGLRRGALREAVFTPDRSDVPSTAECLLALLPMRLHPDAKHALVIGHGAGWTAETALADTRLERIDVAEIDAAVLDAVRSFRRAKQLPVEASGRARLIVADGRVLLRRAANLPDGERYDWIASQPSHPWSPTAGHLFTKESYATARDALNEGGILAQWLNLFDMSPTMLREALATFRGVFDHVWVFRLRGELILLGFRSNPTLAGTRPIAGGGGITHRAGFRTDGDLWKYFALDTAGLGTVLGPGVKTLHDDVPRLEFELAKRRLRAAPPEDAESLLLAGFPPDMNAVFPDANVRESVLAEIVASWMREGAVGEAEAWSRKVRWGVSPEAIAAQAMSAEAAGDIARANALLERAVKAAPKSAALAASWIDVLGTRLAQSPRDAAARASIDAQVTRHSTNGAVLAAAARAYRGGGFVKRARELFEQSVAQENTPPGTRFQLARILMSESFAAEDEKRARTLLANDPRTYEDVDALDILVRLTSDAGDDEQADDLEKALRTLQRARGLDLLRRAAGHVARHEFDDALTAILECRTTWPWHETPWELEGLIRLCLRVERGGEPAEAVTAFQNAIARASAPGVLQRRIRRMLRWFGLQPTLADPVSAGGGH